ncbi:siderophore-interacting protein [Kitasatospora sp. CB01950]|uniref:siderophore-interacting protein n=1 Tax=Kitasatospora sp. CB01950 TaxID=1703930 RepID=UPI00093EEF67|nr:siderophore-interacting protein [Kitasatospora sp. CB01950]OKJ11689.1 FAD-binding protein [Kitasatospora sp. CB01950]
MAYRGQVVRSEWVSPHLIRVVLGGEGLREFRAGTFTDHYIKLHFPRPGVSYPDLLDIAGIRKKMPRDQWPLTRTYTVRSWDPETGEIAVDFVHHGDSGVAGPWAAAAKPGDELVFSGPGGGFAPDPEADWHLLAGDESALPAIAAALEAMPAGAQVKAFVEVSGPEEELIIKSAARFDLSWLHRGSRAVGDALVEAVTSLDFPDGAARVFVHGEAHFVKTLRRHLRLDRGLPREALSVTGYWRLGADEDDWQRTKGEWNRDVEPATEPSGPAA